MSLLPNTQGTFKVILPGETEVTTYTDYTQIPDIDAVVEFKGTLPEAPHSINEHADIQNLYDDFNEILDKTSGTPPATRIGDSDVPHCSGMVRAEGSPNVFVNGIPWSRQTDDNTPHLKPAGDKCITHTAPITTGSQSVFINGKGGGRIGDGITGCTQVAAGSPNVFCGG